MNIILPDTTATQALGKRIAHFLSSAALPVPVFFYGGLGMGKTTLISALVRALPNGEQAETSSPSFTLCNMYATTPPVAHFDFYRQADGTIDESFLDFLDGQRHVVLVEWAERLPEYALPPTRLACSLQTEGKGRMANITAFGNELGAALRALIPLQ